MLARRHNFMRLIVFAALLSGAGPAAGRSTELGPGYYGRVSFSTPVQIGQRVLSAGSYEFHCIHKGKYHLMAVYRAPLNPARRTVALRRPMATDYCRMESLPERVRLTSAVTANKGSGNAVLDEIRIEGEQTRHIFHESVQFDPAKVQSTFDLLRLLVLTGGRR